MTCMEPENLASTPENAVKEPPRGTAEFCRSNYHAPYLSDFGSISDLTKGSLAFGMGDKYLPSILRT